MIEQAITFATIVGLLSDFSSGRAARETAEITEFTEWLTHHNHNDIVCRLEQNQGTTISIKALLRYQNSELKSLLAGLGKDLAALASRIPDFTELTASVIPDTELSDQAFKLLSQMRASNVEYFLVSVTTGGTRLVPSVSASLEFEEEIFLRDDLAVLVELGLLRLTHNSQGSEMYYFTRAGARLIDRANAPTTK